MGMDSNRKFVSIIISIKEMIWIRNEKANAAFGGVIEKDGVNANAVAISEGFLHHQICVMLKEVSDNAFVHRRRIKEFEKKVKKNFEENIPLT